MKKLIPVLLIALLLGCSSQTPNLNLSSLITDHMVLQQNMPVPLWGVSDPGVTVEINSTWGANTKAKADNNGFWKATINTPPAGGPYTLTFSAKKTVIEITDVLIGEVWVCSGQSNMEMTLKGWPPKDTINNFTAEISTANYPNIRMFTVEKNLSYSPLTECKGNWIVCSPETVGDFSATAYYFGKELNKKLDVPIGLINTSWGGTPAESWTSTDYLTKVDGYAEIKNELNKSQENLIGLKKWLNSLDSIDINTLPADKKFAGLKLDDLKYSLPEQTDSSWGTMNLPCLWENAGLPSFDGIVWFRKEFELPKNLYPEGFELNLGPIDDMDVVYINGIKIGGIEEDGFWSKDRVYSIPESTLKEGKNIVAVRVIDTRGGGGIYGKNISINKGNKKVVDLSGNWKYLPIAVLYRNNLYRFTENDKDYSSMPQLPNALEAYTPSLLYNAMIVPLVPYSIKGAIWYQGEANVGRGIQYRQLFPTMIQSWRDAWQQGDFPFYYVQIAPYNYGDASAHATAEVREAQMLTMKEKNVGMVVTMDIGNPLNIHPANKQDVGKRLALWALSKDYGVPDLDFCGPIFKSISFEKNNAIVEFDFADSLVCPDKKLSSFEISDTSGVYYPAEATIEGNKVVVSSKKVKVPGAVRYAWDDDVVPNLFDESGLPASPFRTKE